MFSTLLDSLAIGIGVGVVFFIFLYIWEKVLIKTLKISRVHIRVFEYYRNKEAYLQWKKSQDGSKK